MLMQPTVNGHGERESLFLGGSSAWPVLRCIFALALLANFGAEPAYLTRVVSS